MIYIAGTYESRKQLLTHKRELMRRGFIVTSSWLNGDHEITPKQLAATHDMLEVTAATVLILDLCHDERYTPGKMTEYGMALTCGHDTIVIGDRAKQCEVFFTLADVFVENWDYDIICAHLDVMAVEKFDASDQ